VDSDGFVPCVVVEATRVASNIPPCDQRPGRTPVELGAEVDVDARATLADSGHCGPGTGVDCSDFELCEIAQLDGAARDRCLNEVEESDDGFCYIDAFQEIGNPTLLGRCPESQQQLLRFVGANGGTPTPGAVTLIGCYAPGP